MIRDLPKVSLSHSILITTTIVVVRMLFALLRRGFQKFFSRKLPIEAKKHTRIVRVEVAFNKRTCATFMMIST